MKALPVIIVALMVIGLGKMVEAPASQPVALPAEQAADCDKCPIIVEIPEVPTYVAAVGVSGCDSCRMPVAKGIKKAGKVAGKIAKVPAKAVRAVGRAKPVRRVLGRIFGRRR